MNEIDRTIGASPNDTVETSKVAYQYMSKGYEEELKRADGLNAKHATAVSIASLLAGFVLGFVALAYDTVWQDLAACWSVLAVMSLLLVLALLCFLVALILLIAGLWPRNYWSVPRYTDADVRRWVNGQEQLELLTHLMTRFRRCWQHNKELNDAQARRLRWIFLCMTIGGSLLSLVALGVIIFGVLN